MINNIIKYIRQNTWKFILTVLLIIFVYSLIRIADNAYKKEISETELTQNDSTSIISSQAEEEIEKFLDLCSNAQYEEAYTYLSDECKSNLYPSLENFVDDYCKKNKIKGTVYSIKKEKTTTGYKYKIEFDNSLSTGKKTATKNVDYYTVVTDENGQYKLNINGYLKTE